ncbi:MAG: hypothetical protein F7C36_01725 [Desulfurococcales archaeon]|nr:hypothetical protein [Desulfurococcales archaeon]
MASLGKSPKTLSAGSSTHCKAPGSPDWTGLALRILQESPSYLTRLPGIVNALYRLGIDPGKAINLNLSLGCCGKTYYVADNNSLYTELLHNPSGEVEASIIPIDTDNLSSTLRLFDKLGIPCSKNVMIVNPLGWPLISPIIIDNAELNSRHCLDLGFYKVFPGGLHPLHGFSLSGECLQPSSKDSDTSMELRGFRLENYYTPIGSSKTLQLDVYEGESWIASVWKKSSITILDKDGKGSLEIKSPFYETPIAMLYPYRFVEQVVLEEEFTTVALSAGYEGKSIAIGSRYPFRVRVEPGRLEIEYNRSLRISPGGPLTALRLAVEDSIIHKPIEYCTEGLAHIRSSNSIVLVYSVDPDTLVLHLLAYSPVSDGVAEIRVRAPVKQAFIDDCREREQLLFQHELGRIPLPWGSWYKVEINVRKPLFKLRNKQRSR